MGSAVWGESGWCAAILYRALKKALLIKWDLSKDLQGEGMRWDPHGES